MNWSKLTPQQKAKWLNEQLAELHKAKTVLEHFEQLFENWLKKTQPPKQAA